MDPLRDLTANLVGEANRSHTPFGLYVVAGDHPAAELGRAVEREVFGEVFGNTDEMLDTEYRRYDVGSIFLIVVDHHRLVPAGTSRILVPSPAGHKSLHDLERVWGEPADEILRRSGVDIDTDQLWDVATLAVTREYRGSSSEGLVSLALQQGIVMLASSNGIPWGIAVFDLVVLELVQTLCGRPFQTFEGIEPRRYLDSPSSLPVYCDMIEFQQRLAFTDPDMYEVLFVGKGLEAAVSTPDWLSADVAEMRRAAGFG